MHHFHHYHFVIKLLQQKIFCLNIVFDWSPTSSNTCNFILHYGTGVLNVPADGSIVAAKMAANSVDSDSYVDGSIDAVHLSANSVDSDAYVDASIDNAHLADDAVGVAELSATGTASSSTFLRGDNSWVTPTGFDVSSITGATALGAIPADTDEFVLSDAGVLKRVDYSYLKSSNTPMFRARLSADVNSAHQVNTKVTFNTEDYDTDSAFDTSNGRFTIPSGKAGKYAIYGGLIIRDYQQDGGHSWALSIIYKNGSAAMTSGWQFQGNYGAKTFKQVYCVFDCSVADYFELYYYTVTSDSGDGQVLNNSDGTYFGGHKLIT